MPRNKTTPFYATKNAQAGRAAYSAAIRSMKETYPEEWGNIYGDEREALGLSRVPSPISPEELRARLQRAEARVTKYRTLLGQA
jgi:hypothetical protein